MKEIAVVLLSGGMDSCMCAEIANNMGYEIAALHLNYGQRTQQRELKAFNDICDYYKVSKRLVVDVSFLAQIGGSSLTDMTMDVPPVKLDEGEIPNSYVPFRNANILAIATSWAEVLGAKALVIGAMEGDSSGYPDCRKIFFEAFERTIATGTKPGTEIKIITPLIDLTKAEIISQGLELGVPFELTWSCYKESEQACGECESCALRLRGFRMAGSEDPIEYKKRLEY